MAAGKVQAPNGTPHKVHTGKEKKPEPLAQQPAHCHRTSAIERPVIAPPHPSFIPVDHAEDTETPTRTAAIMFNPDEIPPDLEVQGLQALMRILGKARLPADQVLAEAITIVSRLGELRRTGRITVST